MSKAKWLLKAVLMGGSVLGTSAALLVPAAAMAEQKVSAAVGKSLKTAQEAIQKRKWDQALSAIKAAEGVAGKTAYDK